MHCKTISITLLLQVVTLLLSRYIKVPFDHYQYIMVEKIKNKSAGKCTIQEILDVIGGKWSMSIIYALIIGKLRFKELERLIPGISTRMLVKELKNMEANKILTRTVFPTVPPTVEYELTEKGLELKPILDEMAKWGEKHVA